MACYPGLWRPGSFFIPLSCCVVCPAAAGALSVSQKPSLRSTCRSPPSRCVVFLLFHLANQRLSSFSHNIATPHTQPNRYPRSIHNQQRRRILSGTPTRMQLPRSRRVINRTMSSPSATRCGPRPMTTRTQTQHTLFHSWRLWTDGYKRKTPSIVPPRRQWKRLLRLADLHLAAIYPKLVEDSNCKRQEHRLRARPRSA